MSTSKPSGRHGPRRVTTDAEIIALREQGWSTPKICKELRVGHPRIRRALAGLDIPAPPPTRRGPQPTERRLGIIRLADGTRTIGEIMAELNVSRALVNKVAAQEGLVIPRRRGPAPKAKAPKPTPLPRKAGAAAPKPQATPRRTQVRRPGPLSPERIQPAASPKAPRTASDISPKSTAPTQIATRTCHSCNRQIRESEWSKHMADVHKVVSRNQRQLTALERYIAQIQPEAEPERTPEPPCDICRKTPCEAPTTHARITRMRDQHARRMEQERKKAA